MGILCDTHNLFTFFCDINGFKRLNKIVLKLKSFYKYNFVISLCVLFKLLLYYFYYM